MDQRRYYFRITCCPIIKLFLKEYENYNLNLSRCQILIALTLCKDVNYAN
ncbi:MAG: hypothetical protein ABIM17_05045 [candidate division WOR-3 bacterium]